MSKKLKRRVKALELEVASIGEALDVVLKAINQAGEEVAGDTPPPSEHSLAS